MRKNYFEEVMWPDMLNSPVKTRGQYVYSDVGMCIMQQIVETLTSTPINNYVQQQFYNPLGMQTAGYLPLYRFPVDRIPPTEDDKKDRHYGGLFCFVCYTRNSSRFWILVGVYYSGSICPWGG